jgi:RNA polymerase sigma-70 factor (ECF subfamily)
MEAAEAAPSIHALFTRHFDDVYRMVAHLLGPGAAAADVEDVTQQVFVAAHKALPRYRGEGRPTTWLYGIATRVVLNNLRSWRRRRRLVAALEHSLAEPPMAASPEREAEARQELARVWRCLMRVGAKKRVVYVLHVVEGRSGEEIAELLQIPVATVWTRLHHARRELSLALDREERRRA